MVVDISEGIIISIDPQTCVLHSIATFGMVHFDESLIPSCSSTCQSLLAVLSSVTIIVPHLDQLHRLMFSLYSVAYAVNPTTGQVESHH